MSDGKPGVSAVVVVLPSAFYLYLRRRTQEIKIIVPLLLGGIKPWPPHHRTGFQSPGRWATKGRSVLRMEIKQARRKLSL